MTQTKRQKPKKEEIAENKYDLVCILRHSRNNTYIQFMGWDRRKTIILKYYHFHMSIIVYVLLQFYIRVFVSFEI